MTPKKSAPKASQVMKKTTPPKRKRPKKNDKLFVAEVAVASGQPLEAVPKFLDGLAKACLKVLREKHAVRIPLICQMKMKEQAAKPQREKQMFGQMRTIPARPAKKKLTCGLLRHFKMSANAASA